MSKGDEFLEFKKNLENRIIKQTELLFEQEKAKTILKKVKNFLDKDTTGFVNYLHESSQLYDSLLSKLNIIEDYSESENKHLRKGIIALNGTSGVGQSFVMKFIKKELENRNIVFDRIYLLATREPRSNESHKDPYIFTEKTNKGYSCIHTQNEFLNDDIYYEYESRPGAFNAILKEDIRKANNNLLYLETVIPTLFKMKSENINGIYPLKEDLKIVYLAADSGKEWIYRLVAREPDKIEDENFRNKITGRINSSLEDMKIAEKEKIPTAVHILDYGHITAKKVLKGWNII